MPSTTNLVSQSPTAPSNSSTLLEANLTALSGSSPHVAALIRQTPPADDIDFIPTDDEHALAAIYASRALASKRQPLVEAQRLADRVNLKKAATVAVLGFGVGHHVATLAQRVKRDGLIIVFEPDLPLLRAVFENIDHSEWLASTNVVFLTDPEDSASMSQVTSGAEGVLAMGVEILEHPPSKLRLGDAATRFADRFARIVSSVRTVVVTTMVQTEITLRNLLLNAERYSATGTGAGVADLGNLCADRPAIIVSAGPSLQRNIHLLADPLVRERCLIIAVQTALKPLLAAGVRPHFVTALDYHEISGRFYENLTPDLVAGVTLVAEPKAHPIILDSFPGALRCVGDAALDELLGETIAGQHGELPAGATVAHLAFYLAQHMGANPIAFIGQDLGFTDGQYYAKDAAIHNVWAAELNPFNTLEMMEWQRIVRARATLHKTEDQLGRPIYTDEQMATYLAQFERDFKADSASGRIIIDATEGGVAKQHTTPQPLRDFLDNHVAAALPLPHIPAPTPALSKRRRQALDQRLRDVRAQAVRVESVSRKTIALLERVGELHDDHTRANELIRQIYTLRDEVEAIDPGYRAVQRLNQTGAYKRIRSDRDIRLTDDLSPVERQQRQLQRDITNVEWIADAAAALARLIEESLREIEGDAARSPRKRSPALKRAVSSPESHTAPRVAACMFVDPDRSSLGWKRNLSHDQLRATLSRLAAVPALDAAILLVNNSDDYAALTENPIPNLRIILEPVDLELIRARLDRLRPARLFASSSWRGGLCSMTCYDEIIAPREMASALQKHDFTAALALGADWSRIESTLCDEIITRHTEAPDRHRIVFSQAPPGLAPCLIDCNILTDFANSAHDAGAFATVGGLLGYMPLKPQSDPIAHHLCVKVKPETRDRLTRFIADTRSAHHDNAEHTEEVIAPAPNHLILEITPRRATPANAAANRPDMSIELATNIFSQLAAVREDAVVTLSGFGDPLLHPDLAPIIRAARQAGIAGVHVRTEALAPQESIQTLLNAEPDIISVDLHAATAPTYAQLTGADRFQEALNNVEWLLSARNTVGGLPRTWVVPRIVRRDAVYSEIESFFDRWLLLAGAGVIDQLPAPVEGERIVPLGKPALARRRDWRERMMILSDGAVLSDERDAAGARAIGSVVGSSLGELWMQLCAIREQACACGDLNTPVLWTGH